MQLQKQLQMLQEKKVSPEFDKKATKKPLTYRGFFDTLFFIITFFYGIYVTASSSTSCVTTNPFPVSPALVAFTVAFNANIFVLIGISNFQTNKDKNLKKACSIHSV